MRYISKKSALVVFLGCATCFCGLFFVLSNNDFKIMRTDVKPTPTLIKIMDEEIKFVIARQQIKKGEKIRSDFLKLHNDSTFDPPADAFTNEADVIGKIAKEDILPGQLILPNMLVVE